MPRTAVLPAAAKAAPPPGKAGKAAAKEAKPERLALAGAAERAASPGCAAAGGALFCLDKGGGVHRWTLHGDGGDVIAQARSGSPLTAAALAGGHVAYAFLADRRTTEGATTLAFVALDDATPITLSEDGSGATHVVLASRGDDAVALYVDARRVLTPVHARVLSAPSGKLVLGTDAVVFVGGGTDGRTLGTIAREDGHELALLPIDKDDKAFGMAAIRVEEQPRDDAAVTWSLYPATMERPAIAATQGVTPIRVLYARPASADPKGKKVLELRRARRGGRARAALPGRRGHLVHGPGDLRPLARARCGSRTPTRRGPGSRSAEGKAFSQARDRGECARARLARSSHTSKTHRPCPLSRRSHPTDTRRR